MTTTMTTTIAPVRRKSAPAAKRTSKPRDLRWLTERPLPSVDKLPENPVLALRRIP